MESTEKRPFAIPAAPIAPEDAAMKARILDRLDKARIDNVLAVFTPTERAGWALILQAGGRNPAARGALAKVPGVTNVRCSEQSGSIVLFDVE